MPKILFSIPSRFATDSSFYTTTRIASRIALCLIATLALTGVVAAAPVKVAFIGDQSVGSNARSVLQLVANEGTDLLMIQGDLGYGATAASQWEANLNESVGPNFPVLVVVGNHENFEWPLYQSLTQRRIDRASGLSCDGNVGVKATCQFENIDIVQVSPGIHEVAGVLAEDNYADYIRSVFDGANDRWRICSWHKNQNALQTGSKGDATGWDIYDACLDAGAMIAVAHEHAYSRTYLLSDFENQTVVHRNNDMTLQPGQSFVFVSGLGGREIRPQQRGGDWWASIYTATQGATHGALFCEFEESVAECYFKAIDGSVPDQFTVRRGSQNNNTLSAATISTSDNAIAAAPIAGYVFSRTDKEEYRWIDNMPAGGLGNIWIDRACADQLGGPVTYGNWSDLENLAPAMDAIANPCANDGSAVAATSSTSLEQGYVFSRSDKEEYRWIERNASGEMGNIWIDEACAQRLGGSVASGDWGDLVNLAPAMDSIDSPCLANQQAELSDNANNSTGYVFSRTDKEEYRWIDRDSAGRTANVWIDRDCADRLGGASMSGDWKELNNTAPLFDAIPNPCN